MTFDKMVLIPSITQIGNVNIRELNWCYVIFWYLLKFLSLLCQAMAEPRTPSTDRTLDEFAAPTHVEEVREQMAAFAGHHASAGRRVVLITSGGTKVPLESRTVRFLDNFSSGRRGASSAEYFIESGYAVIFLHRHRSLYPYNSMFSSMNMLEALKFRSAEDASSDAAEVVVNQQVFPNITKVLRKYQEVKENRLLLPVEFNTLSDYLHLLKASAQALSTIGRIYSFKNHSSQHAVETNFPICFASRVYGYVLSGCCCVRLLYPSIRDAWTQNPVFQWTSSSKWTSKYQRCPKLTYTLHYVTLQLH